jgi:hypothetical protein
MPHNTFTIRCWQDVMRSGVKNLGVLEGEILRCAQMTNNRVLIALLYENGSVGRASVPASEAARDGRSTNTSHFIVRCVRKEIVA